MSEEHIDAQLWQEAERTRPKKNHSFTIYLTVLFAAAFFLLGYSYLQQQRVHTGEVRSAAQTVSDLRTENEALRASLQTAEAELEAAAARLDETQTALDETHAALDAQIVRSASSQCALDWLREIQASYAARRYRDARARLTAFEALELPQYLSAEPLHTFDGADAEAPAASYQAIRDALF